MCLLSAFFKVPIIGFLESEEKEVLFTLSTVFTVFTFSISPWPCLLPYKSHMLDSYSVRIRGAQMPCSFLAL